MPRHPKNTFGPTERIMRQYAQGITKIAGRVLTPKRPEQTLEQWLAELADRSQAKDVQAAAETLAGRMVRWTNIENARTWREAAARTQHSQKLSRLLQVEMQGATGEAVRNLIAANAQYIRSVSVDAAAKLVHEVRTAQQNGARPKTIAKMMRQRFPKLLRSRVHLISRTESAKASLALTQARSAEVGAAWYVWRTSEDKRVRRSHRLLDGVVFRWSAPPDPEHLAGERSSLGRYGPGGCPNCRCVPIVLLSPDDVSWPRRVHNNGGITQMTKQQFLAVM